MKICHGCSPARRYGNDASAWVHRRVSVFKDGKLDQNILIMFRICRRFAHICSFYVVLAKKYNYFDSLNHLNRVHVIS